MAMKIYLFKIPAVRRCPGGILFYWLPCRLTAWGIMFGSFRIQWKDHNGWTLIFRNGI